MKGFEIGLLKRSLDTRGMKQQEAEENCINCSFRFLMIVIYHLDNEI